MIHLVIFSNEYPSMLYSSRKNDLFSIIQRVNIQRLSKKTSSFSGSCSKKRIHNLDSFLCYTINLFSIIVATRRNRVSISIFPVTATPFFLWRFFRAKRVAGVMVPVTFHLRYQPATRRLWSFAICSHFSPRAGLPNVVTSDSARVMSVPHSVC